MDFSCFDTHMSYSIIFWGISTYSMKIFKLQVMIVRIMTNIRSRGSCREAFQELRILPFYSQYIYSLLTFVLNNTELCITNSVVSNINARPKKKHFSPSTSEINSLPKGSSLLESQGF
jgi:hypothetical protein